MNVFYEFAKIAEELAKRDVEYALIGGVAVCYYTEIRHTKDVDFLIHEDQLDKVKAAMKAVGYFPSSEPWDFRDSKMTMHRFKRIDEDESEMIVDVLVAGTIRHEEVIDNALVADSETLGKVRVARKEDLIWLKQARNSDRDKLDIRSLSDESN